MTLSLRQVSLLWGMMYAPQREKLLLVNNAYHSLRHFQTRQATHFQTSVKKYDGTDCDPEIWPLPWIDQTSWAVVML